jgi:hypothetical protein
VGSAFSSANNLGRRGRSLPQERCTAELQRGRHDDRRIEARAQAIFQNLPESDLLALSSWLVGGML